MGRFLRWVSVVVGAVTLLSVAAQALPQNATDSRAPDDGVVLVQLSRPAYPLIARQAYIQGDLKLTLEISPDGTVESAVVNSGPALLVLRQAALLSAQQSKFECRGCSGPVTLHQMTYSFQLGPPIYDCSVTQVEQTYPPQVTQTQEGQITVVGRALAICEPTAKLVRSSKCLWLWRCGERVIPTNSR